MDIETRDIVSYGTPSEHFAPVCYTAAAEVTEQSQARTMNGRKQTARKTAEMLEEGAKKN